MQRLAVGLFKGFEGRAGAGAGLQVVYRRAFKN